MTRKELINRLAELDDAIVSMDKRLKFSNRTAINNMYYFPALYKKWMHTYEIQVMAYNRLKKAFDKTINDYNDGDYK